MGTSPSSMSDSGQRVWSRRGRTYCFSDPNTCRQKHPTLKSNSGHFVRGHPEALCNTDGIFFCDGRHGFGCDEKHRLQAYLSILHRKRFQLLENDHVIPQMQYKESIKRVLRKYNLRAAKRIHRMEILACGRENLVLCERGICHPSPLVFRDDDLDDWIMGRVRCL